MKISKIIVPIMALTTLNNFNNNQATAIRFEKEINVPYEILSRESEYNYFINQQNNQVATAQTGRESGIIYESLASVDGYVEPTDFFSCEYILQRLAACWQIPDLAAATACSVFWGGLAAAGGCI